MIFATRSLSYRLLAPETFSTWEAMHIKWLQYLYIYNYKKNPVDFTEQYWQMAAALLPSILRPPVER